MNIIILLAIIGAVLGFILADDTWPEDRFHLAVASSALLSIAGLLIMLILSASGPTTTKETEIVSLKDNVGTTGGFVSVSQDGYYFFYEKDGDSYKLSKEYASDYVKIYEDGQRKIVRHYSVPSFWRLKMEQDNIEIHVPKGSIVRDIKLDAE